jgi:hypothetical protein
VRVCEIKTALERRESLYRQVVDEYSQHQIEHRNEMELLNGEIRRLEDELVTTSREAADLQRQLQHLNDE